MNKAVWILGVLVLTGMKLPDSFSCSGTEPFWGFRNGPKGAIFDSLGNQKSEMPLKQVSVSSFMGMPEASGFIFRGKDKGGKPVTLTYVPAKGCSDGMSERTYRGYGVFDNGTAAYYGCCVPEGKAP